MRARSGATAAPPGGGPGVKTRMDSGCNWEVYEPGALRDDGGAESSEAARNQGQTRVLTRATSWILFYSQSQCEARYKVARAQINPNGARAPRRRRPEDEEEARGRQWADMSMVRFSRGHLGNWASREHADERTDGRACHMAAPGELNLGEQSDKGRGGERSICWARMWSISLSAERQVTFAGYRMQICCYFLARPNLSR